MRPAILLFLGWLLGKHQSIIGKFCKSQLGSVFFFFLNGEWVFKGNFWIEGKSRSQGLESYPCQEKLGTRLIYGM